LPLSHVVFWGNCTVAHNEALGGPGQSGGSAGDGTGGGIACIAGATLTVTDCTVEHNHAQGGETDSDGQGGNGSTSSDNLAP
jgi:hypothetical protein